MHKDPVQVARLHGAYLDSLLTPAHDLVGMDVGWRAGENLEEEECEAEKANSVFPLSI